MKKNSRAQKFYSVALSELNEGDLLPGERNLLRAMAVMIAEATKPKAVKKREEAATKLTLDFQVDELLLACGVDPLVTPGPFFGRLGKLCHELKLTKADLVPLKEHVFNRVRPWCDANDVPVSADTVLNRLPKWLAAARAANPTTPDNTPERFR